MNETVEEVCKREYREYRSRDDETLARSRYLSVYAQGKLPQKDRQRFERLRTMNLKTGRVGDQGEFSRILEKADLRGRVHSNPGMSLSEMY